MREATFEDLPSIIQMGRRFHKKGKLPGVYDPQSASDFAANLIRSPDGVILIGESGMIAGALNKSFGSDWLMAIEVAWWSEGREGLKLLRGFEAWAKDKGANEVRMSTLAEIPRVPAILQRRGYEVSELSHRKAL